jgi:hypothetical protein
MPPKPKRKTAAKTPRKLRSLTDGNVDAPREVPEYSWPLRSYQQASIDAFDAGKRRQMLIWHRRAGKDIHGMSLTRRESLRRVGGYTHFFPKQTQARRALWNGVDPRRGENFVDLAFGDIIASRNNTDMFLEFENGSTWQLLGSDNYDRFVGANSLGVIFSEWALCDPRAWDFVKPIIRENGGWALFITTYRGRNHAWQMVQRLADNPDWFIDVRDVTQTCDVDGNRILTDEDIAKERADGTSEGIIQQEYFCNPAAAVPGAVYSKGAQELLSSPARRDALWNPLKPVYVAWDLRQAPITSAAVHIQAGERPAVLAVDTFPFMDFGEAMAAVKMHRWPIAGHILGEDDEAFSAVFDDFRAYPEIARNRRPGAIEVQTQAFVSRMSCASDGCDDLIDALTGYTRNDATVEEARPVFSADYANTWHAQLVRPLENYVALYGLDDGDDWHRPQHYRNHDRRVI